METIRENLICPRCGKSECTETITDTHFIIKCSVCGHSDQARKCHHV